MASLLRAATLAAYLTLIAASAQAADVAGTHFDDDIVIEKARINLNGAGYLGNAIIRLYAIGLYLPEKKTASADVLSLSGAKRIEIVPLHDLPAEKFAEAMANGITKNHSADEVANLRARIDQLYKQIAEIKTTARGSSIRLDWQPRSGTQLVYNGNAAGTAIPGEDFYRALLRIWLGTKVTDEKLRDALLGTPQT